MATAAKRHSGVPTVKKELLRQMTEEMNARIGLQYDPTATPEEARRLIEADGVRPEENTFSRGIIAARDEE
jgi:hypothetical protein